MADHNFIFSIFAIFTGAALLATLALYTRQSLLVAYIVLGMLLGPSGLKLVPNLEIAHDIGDIGIIFLLFLLGLELTPHELLTSLRKTTLVTLVFSILFTSSGFAVGYYFGFSFVESLLIGASLIFSSTIIGLKLLPSLALHHKPIGETMVSVLLLQDLLAIVMLLLINGASLTNSRLTDIGLAFIILPVLLILAFWVQHYVIAKLFHRFERVSEYIILLALAWCLGLAQLSHILGLSSEIGAFIAGVAIAEGPIAVFIANNLKSLRDFCLTLFFFAIGASFSLQYLPEVLVPALILASLVLLLKPWLFKVLLSWSGEKKSIATEVGVRLGQASEFSLLIAYLAAETEITPAVIGSKANYLIQAVTILTFIVSSYWVVLRYPTPLALKDTLLVD
jgi:Kef-type K+ transport system membrane component KefB